MSIARSAVGQYALNKSHDLYEARYYKAFYVVLAGVDGCDGNFTAAKNKLTTRDNSP